MVSELFRAFQRFSELFRDFQRFSEVFRDFSRPSQRPSQSAIFLSELGVVLPLIVLPLKTPATWLVFDSVFGLFGPPGPRGSGNSSRTLVATLGLSSLHALLCFLKYHSLQNHCIRDSGTTTKYSKWHFPAEKSVDFPPWGLLTFAGNPAICTVKRRFPHPGSRENYRRIL